MNIRYRIEYQIILLPQSCNLWILFPFQCHEWQKVHKTLKKKTYFLRLVGIEMANVFRCNATLEERIAQLITTTTVRKANSKITFVVDLIMYLLANWFGDFYVNTSVLQVSNQSWMRQRKYLQVLKSCRTLFRLHNSRRCRNHTWNIVPNLMNEIRHIRGFVELLCQIYDVSTLANTEVVPFIGYARCLPWMKHGSPDERGKGTTTCCLVA